MEEIRKEVEEAAATLGANRFQTITRVLLPGLQPAILTGFALAFARAVGEYGSVIFIAGNLPYVSEIAPLLIVIRLEEFDYAGATAIAAIMLLHLLRHAFCHQSHSGVEPQEVRLWHLICPNRKHTAKVWHAATTESRAARSTLIAITLAFLGLFLLMPLVSVFVEAFRKGPGEFFAALLEPDAQAAIRLTLLVAATAVPLNVIFGIVAAWTIAKFEFKGKAFLTTLIDLPFSVSPVISGLVYVLLFSSHSVLGPWLKSHGIEILFAVPGIVLATMFVTFPFVARELIPLMQHQGTTDEEAALSLGANGWQTFWHVTLPKH